MPDIKGSNLVCLKFEKKKKSVYLSKMRLQCLGEGFLLQKCLHVSGEKKSNWGSKMVFCYHRINDSMAFFVQSKLLPFTNTFVCTEFLFRVTFFRWKKMQHLNFQNDYGDKSKRMNSEHFEQRTFSSFELNTENVMVGLPFASRELRDKNGFQEYKGNAAGME